MSHDSLVFGEVRASQIENPRAQWLIIGLAIAVSVLSIAVGSIALAGLCGVLILALIRFEFFVYVSVLLLPWYPLLTFDLSFNDATLLARFVLFAGVWVIRRREGESLSDWFLGNRLKKCVLLFASVAVLSVLLSSIPASTDSYRSLVRLLSYLMVFFAISGWVTEREQVFTIIKVLLVSTIGVALFGFYQAFDGSYTDFYFSLYPSQEGSIPEWTGRISSLLFHFNSLAGYLNLVLPFAVACMVLAKERGLRILGFVCQVAGAAALYLTGSRGGAIGYVILLSFCVWRLKSESGAVFKIAASLVLAALLVLPFQSESDAGRLQDVDEATQDSRLALWGAAMEMFVDHPALGVGYGGYRLLYNGYLGYGGEDLLDAHNLYLQLLAEMGVGGLVIFDLMVTGFSRLVLRLVRETDPLLRIVAIGSGGALLATLCHGMVDYLFNASPQFGGLFWLILGLLATCCWNLRQIAGEADYAGMAAGE